MIPDPILAGITEAVFGYALERAGALEWLRDRAVKQAFKAALGRAYQTFAARHPQWSASLFDQSFLQHEGASVLAQLLLPDGDPDPSDLAARWADSLNARQSEQRTTYVRDLEPVAAEFLDGLAHELHREPKLRDLNDSRSLHQLVENSDALRTSIGADKATAGTRRDYLRWITQSNRYLDSRGVAQIQRQVQVRLDEIYISLQARRETSLGSVDRRLLEQELLDLQRQFDAAIPAERREDLEEQARARYEMRHLRGEAAVPAELLDLAEAVLRHDRLVVLGDPGSGKSTLLRYLALNHGEALYRGLGDAAGGLGPPRFPILIRVAEYAEAGKWKQVPLSEFMEDYCRLHECATTGLSSLLASELAGGNCLVLLDGLDEITSADDRRGIVQRIEDFVRHHGSQANRFVVTSRVAGYRSAPLDAPFTHFTVRDMDTPQIAHFLHRWCNAVENAQTPDLAAELRAENAQREIDGIMDAVRLPGVRRLATNPLLLRVLALIHHTGAQLPQRRIDLYRLAADTLARNWRIAARIPESALAKDEHLTPLLGELAYWLHSTKPTGIATEAEVHAILGKYWTRIRNVPWDEDTPNPAVLEEVRTFLLQVREHTGLFVERAPRRYGFMHLTFEEYYAARHLIARGRTAPTLIREHLHDPRWEEPIVLALGFKGLDYPVEAAELFATAILASGDEAEERHFAPSPYEDTLGRDYLFALRCLGDQIPVGIRIVDLVDRLARELLQQAGLARYGRYRAALKDRIASLAGSEAGARLATLLCAALRDLDAGVRQAAAEGLGRLGQHHPEAAAALIAGMRDGDAWVRQAAVRALGGLARPGPEAAAVLVAGLRDGDMGVRNVAAVGLGQLGWADPEAAAALVASLRDGDVGVRQAAAVGLGRLGQRYPEAAVPLVAALRDEDTGVRWEAEGSLIRLGRANPEVTGASPAALQDRDAGVRREAAGALGRLGQGSAEVVAALVATLQDGDGWVRREAAGSLARLDQAGPEAAGALVAALRNRDARVRWEAAAALARLGHTGSEARALLLEGLWHHLHRNGRMDAAMLLATHHSGGDDLIVAFLRGLRDNDHNVRGACATGLATLGQRFPGMRAAIAEKLLRCLQSGDADKPDEIREGAYDALWQLVENTTTSRRT